MIEQALFREHVTSGDTEVAFAGHGEVVVQYTHNRATPAMAHLDDALWFAAAASSYFSV